MYQKTSSNLYDLGLSILVIIIIILNPINTLKIEKEANGSSTFKLIPKL